MTDVRWFVMGDQPRGLPAVECRDEDSARAALLLNNDFAIVLVLNHDLTEYTGYWFKVGRNGSLATEWIELRGSLQHSITLSQALKDGVHLDD
jgi:hypothetical protein